MIVVAIFLDWFTSLKLVTRGTLAPCLLTSNWIFCGKIYFLGFTATEVIGLQKLVRNILDSCEPLIIFDRSLFTWVQILLPNSLCKIFQSQGLCKFHQSRFSNIVSPGQWPTNNKFYRLSLIVSETNSYFHFETNVVNNTKDPGIEY